MSANSHSLTSLLVGMLSNPSVLEDCLVTGISLDSRQVTAGNLFFSLAKELPQREQNLKQALTAEAKVVLYDDNSGLSKLETQYLEEIKVKAYPIKHLTNKVGEIAARFYGHPSLALTVIAVTGTNGKTSVSQFIAQAFETMNFSCGVIGTLGVGRINALKDTGMTTPDPVSVQRILAEFCQQNIQYAVIEASSHALAQGRLNNVTIDVAVLTNLTRDHLDYHKSMDEYALAKSRLFDFSSLKTAVINSSDEFGQRLISILKDRKKLQVLSFSSDPEEVNTDFIAKNNHQQTNGIRFKLVSEFGSKTIHSHLIGRFNIDNLLATTASLIAVGVEFDKVVTAVSQCHSISGRMEMFGGGAQAHIVIDFAHTPDALIQALKSLRTYVQQNGHLWCVFGCGGDRDSGKRTLMGQAADQYADQLVITDDNPRNEKSEKIIQAIMTGIEHQEKVVIEKDRKLAITYAIKHANANDIVLIAGKGHEQYQDVLGVKYPFSDKQVMTDVLLAANDESIHKLEAK